MEEKYAWQSAIAENREFAHTGLSLYVIFFFLFAGSAGVFWLVSTRWMTTTYSVYIPHLGAILIVFDLLIALAILPRVTRPYNHLRKELFARVANSKIAGERYELALMGSSEGFWDYNIKTNDVYFSAHLMSLLGYAPEDKVVPLAFWHDAIHPDDVEGVRRTLDAHMDKRAPEYGGEYRIRKSSGEYIWVEDKGRAVWDEDGKPMRVAGITRDVGNIKRVQEVLQSRTTELEDAQKKIEAEIANVKKFQKAVDASTEAVSITTPDGNIVYVNPAWVRLNGFTDTESIGRNSRLLKSEKTAPEIFHAMWEKINAGISFSSEEIFNKRKDGTQYQAGLSIFPIREGAQILFFVSICQDITQRKEIDRAKTEFVSLASHQLRTPLSAIRWYSEMLMSKYVGELNDKQRQYINEIYQGNLRMVDLVDALLNVSRIDLGTFAIEPEPVNLVSICESVLSELTPGINNKKQNVDRIYANAPQTYNADPKLIRIVFQNFLSNSVKYTPEAGHILVEISEKEQNLYIRVTDDGYGIPKSQQSKMFEKLFRADNVRQKDTEGTGLGMYIVKAIVDSSGGRLWFESEENHGTTFHVLLPLSGMPKKTGVRGLS